MYREAFVGRDEGFSIFIWFSAFTAGPSRRLGEERFKKRNQ
jgi:hypothetical protein